MALRKIEVPLEQLFCGGTQRVTHNGKQFTLEIQPGWKPGTKLRFDNDGVVFELAQQEHERFTRVGNDLCTVAYPSPISLLTGCTHDVQMLNGQTQRVAFDRFVLRVTVEGKGMPYKETDAVGTRVTRKGDLVVYLYANWSELRASASSWGRTVMYIGGAWLFMTNTSMFLTMMFIYSVIRQQL